MEGSDLTADGSEAAAGLEAERLFETRAARVLASTPLTGDHYANALWGADLANKLADPDEARGLFVLDVRQRADYEQGHIEGSVNAEFSRALAPGNLAAYPRDRRIVVICYTGNLAPQVTSGLRLLGYDAVMVRTGMNGFTQTAMTAKVMADIEAARRPVEREEAAPGVPAPAGIGFERPATAEGELLAVRLDGLFTGTATEGDFAFNTVSAAELEHLLDRQDIYLLDVRKEEDFEGVGHIAGSARVDFNAAAQPENLALLPRDRKIVVNCYTGNMAAQLVTVLRLLGYDAAALNYGMVGWSPTPVSGKYLKDIREADGALVGPGA